MVISLTAAALRAMLVFIDPQGGPMIAGTKDLLAEPLMQRIRAAVGDYHGSTRVTISFALDERELAEEFLAVVTKVTGVFSNLGDITASLLS